MTIGRRRALTRLVVVVSAAGGVALADSVASLPSAPQPLAWLLVGAVTLLASVFTLKVPGVAAHLSISDTFFITSALLFGPAPATLTIAIDSLLMSWTRRHTTEQMLFNLTAPALSLWVAAHVFFALAGTRPMAAVPTPPDAGIIAPLACFALVYYLLNSGLLAAAVALDTGVPPLQLWRRHFTVISLNYFASASAAFVLVVLVKFVSPIAVLALAPVIVIFYLAMRSWLGRLQDADSHIAQMNRLYLSTVTALATAIEAKDGVTSDHIHRVQTYAMGLARALGITDEAMLKAIEAAALLHDTGKIAVPEHILNKPGGLTPAEFDAMKLHVEVGAAVLSSIDFPYPVVPIVEAHHENWDGSGYPRGLAGEAIPIGARILAVVDCFDALTSGRPYRAALRDSDAIEIIRKRRGTFYDPAVVDTFLRVYRDIAPAALQPQLHDAMRRVRRGHSASDTHVAAARVDAAAPMAGSSEELLAFVSLARIATRTPTIADIGALASSHLREIAPNATLALYAMDPVRHLLVAEYCSGQAATRLSGVTIAIGQRVSGWAAANGRAMMNADAALDLVDGLSDSLTYAVAVPLVAEGVVVGVMTLYREDPFPDDCCRRLEMIAPHLATAVSRAVAMASGVNPAAFAAVAGGPVSYNPRH